MIRVPQILSQTAHTHHGLYLQVSWTDTVFFIFYWYLTFTLILVEHLIFFISTLNHFQPRPRATLTLFFYMFSSKVIFLYPRLEIPTTRDLSDFSILLWI